MAGRGMFGRALGGGALTAGSYAVAQGLRLVSNLVLARLLFPEAFGVMALVTVVLVGLQMLSDAGVGPAIGRSPRGDEADFLDTAFTINLCRGALLWLLAAALALPVAGFYGVPELAVLLPVAGAAMLLAGATPTRVDTANRHLMLGRVTVLDLAAQVGGMAATIALAWALHSVWALALGMVVQAALRLGLMWTFLPGRGNRLRWEPAAGRELVRFGGWIFLSSTCGFLLAQGDRAILGAHLGVAELGIYNIGYFLASFPMLMAMAVVARIMIPLYREHAPGAAEGNAGRMRRLRLVLGVPVLLGLALVALAGDGLVGLLYDDRYLAAGAMITGIALAQMPAVVGMTYDQAALVADNGRGYFLTLAAKAALQTAGLLIGVWAGGLGGALAGQGLALVLAHPVIVRLARRHGVWDAAHDLGVGALALVLAAGVIALRWEALAGLFG